MIDGKISLNGVPAGDVEGGGEDGLGEGDDGGEGCSGELDNGLVL